MKSTTAKIEIMQAHIDGKQIEFTRAGKDEWQLSGELAWDWLNFDYRVKSHWFDAIPKQGVLCFVRNARHLAWSETPVAIIAVDRKSLSPYHSEFGYFTEAKPLTEEELLRYVG